MHVSNQVLMDTTFSTSNLPTKMPNPYSLDLQWEVISMVISGSYTEFKSLYCLVAQNAVIRHITFSEMSCHYAVADPEIVHLVRSNPPNPSLAHPDSYTSGGGGRESGKVLYIKLSQCLV